MPQCMYCDEELKLDVVDGYHFWVHKNGNLYKGMCFCKDTHHKSYKEKCPTWWDDHCAVPKWRGQ